MEGIGVIIAIIYALNEAKFLAVHFGEAPSKTFGRSTKETEVEVILLAIFITSLGHMFDNLETLFSGLFVFTVVFAEHSFESFGNADKTNRK